MPTPAISVVIPTHNRRHYIGQTLDSVFAQSFKDYEIIVVDDGSTDGTGDSLASLIRKKKIRYEHQDARGVSAARNRGVGLARSPYIAFLDSDDLFLTTKLEKQMQVFAQDPKLGFVHCKFSKFDVQGNDLGIRDTSLFQGQIYPWMLQEWSVLMAMPCLVIRTDVLTEVGGFDENMDWAEDLDLWRRIARRYRVGVVPEVLVKVRVHSASATFERSGGEVGFRRYLDKAFAEDRSLGWAFRQRAYGKMFVKLGQNLLGEGSCERMSLVRKYCLKAFLTWPLQFSALVVFFASLLPRRLRHSLAQKQRRARYPTSKV